jgi:hypothetical protein
VCSQHQPPAPTDPPELGRREAAADFFAAIIPGARWAVRERFLSATTGVTQLPEEFRSLLLCRIVLIHFVSKGFGLLPPVLSGTGPAPLAYPSWWTCLACSCRPLGPARAFKQVSRTSTKHLVDVLARWARTSPAGYKELGQDGRTIPNLPPRLMAMYITPGRDRVAIIS